MVSIFGEVPFLNGGLFEKTDLDQRDEIIVPDEAIKPILSDLFDRFNFTVMESTPFDVEVAVDPEMLGKVFEELVTGRHASGAYYTPRPVVAFMCREALKGYLEGQNTGITSEAIAQFVDERDTSGISSVASAQNVAKALDEVTVVDPACGSGAYLLGMMQELVELQTALFNVGVDAKGLYELKLHIIERNLYGVDIDDFAANIAMLRLWLSLAIEYEGDQPEPLPNLDFKVVCGDSLLGPDPSVGVMAQSSLGRDDDTTQKLDTLKSKYMRARTGSQKQNLREAIRGTEELIKTAMGDAELPDEVVEWRLQFAEVFGQHGGFDVAIANPPYVRYQKIPKDYKKALKPRYGHATVGQSDLYCYFYVRALQLLATGGMHVFVCSNSWLDVAYGAKLQEYFLTSAHIQAIYESAVERQFSTAAINTIISFILKTEPKGNDITDFVSLREEFDSAVGNAEQRRNISRRQGELLNDGRRGAKYIGHKWGANYLRAPDIHRAILNKGSDRLLRLSDLATARFGIITGANAFFYLSDDLIEEWGIEERFVEPLMSSPRESRSIAVDPSKLPYMLLMCHEPKSNLRNTAVLEYIRWGETRGFHSKSACVARSRWYDLGRQRPTQIAITYMIDTTARVFFMSDGAHFPNTFHRIYPRSVSPLGLCAAMNSTLFQLMVNLSGRSNLGGGALKIERYELDSLLVPHPKVLKDIDECTLRSTNWDVLSPSPERRMIDDAVFDALDLTRGERDAVYEAVTELVENRRQKARSV